MGSLDGEKNEEEDEEKKDIKLKGKEKVEHWAKMKTKRHANQLKSGKKPKEKTEQKKRLLQGSYWIGFGEWYGDGLAP
uniref:Uncharacterized protein n=1 Tax=Tanacetum cinerariifolium TaxID=118510 RepID=A0A6L2JKK4_TANCI|nr:hypothetical protein [Tanacetum cinerariifolium]